MKKLLAIFLLAAMFLAFPAYAADSINPNVKEKIQNVDPNLYQEIKNTVNQFQNNNAAVNTSANQLKSEFKHNNQTISEIVQKPNVQALIIDILKYEDVRMQIHDLTQRDDIRNAIWGLMDDPDIKNATDVLMANPEISNYVFMIVYGE